LQAKITILSVTNQK